MKELRVGAVVVRGREVMVLNFSGQWLAPGVMYPMSAPDSSWDVLRYGFDEEVK